MSSPALIFRPVAPTDREELAAAFERLSPDSRYRRFLGPEKVLTSRELTHLTDVDHVGHEAFVAVALSRRVIARAGVNGFAKRFATTLWENDPARCLMSKLGFRPTGSSRGVVELELQLVPAGLRPGSVGEPRWSSVS